MKKLANDNYDLYGNKLYIFSDNLEKLNLRKIGEGTEGTLYVLDNKHLIKIYKKNLIEEQEEIYNEFRIEEIARRRDLIRNTHLVYGPVFLNGEFAGALTHFHRFSPSLEVLNYIPSNDYKIDRFLEINDNLKELENNGIYYVDLTSKNVLLPRLKKTRIIDTDGKSTRLDDYDREYYKRKMYESLFHLILQILFHFDIDSLEEDVPREKDYIDIIFENSKIDKEILSEIRKEKFNYELIREFLLQLKDKKELKLKMA